MSDRNLHPVMQGVFAPHMPEVAKSTLDTSGVVPACVPTADPGILGPCGFHDLDAFTQGAFEEAARQAVAAGIEPEAVAFRNWSAEALAAILKDCAAFTGGKQWPASSGAFFWVDRQRGDYATEDAGRYFPPLTVSLGDDGKVHLTARAA